MTLEDLLEIRRTKPLLSVVHAMMKDPTKEWSGYEMRRDGLGGTDSAVRIFGRLEAKRFVTSRWEEPEHGNGRRRRLYKLTGEGMMWAHNQDTKGAFDFLGGLVSISGGI